MKTLTFSTALAILIFTEIGRADSLDAWTPRSPLPTGNTLHSIVYGNGLFVAVGDAGTIVTSLEGTNWVLRQSGTQSDLSGIAYGKGQFVAVGYGIILTSADGMNWIQRQAETTDSTAALLSVAYGNGQFVAVRQFRSIVTSTDSVNWVPSEPFMGQPGGLYGIAYANGMFVAVGGGGTWTMGPNSNLMVTSRDAVNWVERRLGTETSRLNGIAYGNGQFVAVGDAFNGEQLESPILISSDGTNWVQRESGTLISLGGIAYGNGHFVAVGDSIFLTSTDGVTWVQRQSGTQDPLNGISYGNGHFVAVGGGGTILQSGNIITVAVTSDDGTGLLSLSLEGPTGLAYAIQSSTDLIAWQTLTNITSVQPTSVIFDPLPGGPERVFYRAYSQ